MIKDITIGQYYPGTSFIHRLDPRTKILLTIVYIVALFLVDCMWGFAVIGALMAAIIAVSGISAKIVLKSMKPLMFIILFTAAFNLLYGGGAVIFPSVSWLGWLTWGGVRMAVFMIIRIILLICGTSFMTYTTSPIMLTNALERLLAPFKKLKLPVHELAMMMSIALRFIPTLVDETDKIVNAQKARGADFETGSILKRAKALIPVFVPLIVSAFRRADELAEAMECRCYHGDDGRTRYKAYSFSLRDALAALIMSAVVAMVLLLNFYL